MKITKIVQQETEIVEDIICNKCGGSCKCSLNFNGLIEAEIVGCYDSPFLEDETIYSFSLCEKCLVDLMKEFKHEALIRSYF